MYRKDICTCENGIECESDKKWRKKHSLRKPSAIKTDLDQVLRIAEEKLAEAISLGYRSRIKSFKAQVAMVHGRIKRRDSLEKERRYAEVL